MDSKSVLKMEIFLRESNPWYLQPSKAHYRLKRRWEDLLFFAIETITKYIVR
jgi:hypothetical protein